MTNQGFGERCSFCEGPWHAATGCYYGPRIRACYACTVTAWAWIVRQTNGKARRKERNGHPRTETALSFYEHAGRRP